MARGFLSGAIWGTVLSVGGLGALSVLMPPPAAVIPSAPEPRIDVAEPAVQEPVVDTATSDAAPDTVPEEPAVEAVKPEPDVPTPSETAAPTEPEAAAEPEPTAQTDASGAAITPEQSSDVAEEPAETPVGPETIDAQVTPDDGTSAALTTPARRPEDVTPVAPTADAPALNRPADPQEPTIADTVAAPVPAPDTGAEIAALDPPDVGAALEVPAVSAPEAAPGSANVSPLNPPASETGLSVSTEPAQPPAPPVPAVEAPLVPDPAPAVPTETAVEPAPEATPSQDSTASERPPVRRLIPSAPDADTAAVATAPAAPRPAIGTPAASLTDRNPGNSARLPSIGGAEEAATPPDTSAQAVDASLSPLKRFAAAVDSDPSLPKMSIVMIDDGTGPLGPDTLDGFPFPVTFAIDPAQPGASDRMSAYRALGYEVAALVSVPTAALPSDVEQILGGAIAAVPEAVALIEAPGGGLQAARNVTEQAASFAADSGHGLIFLPNGLNTAQAIAQRETVPALSILRDFDGEGQDARTKRRFLDGAAFRARQDGAVVMLGRLTPDTLSALVLWSLQDRASSVSMVPVSTLLLEQVN